MMEHGSPTYLVEALLAALRSRGLAAAALPMDVHTVPGSDVPTPSERHLSKVAAFLATAEPAQAAATLGDAIPADEESVVAFVCWWP
jgi:hypothetical protein